MQKLPNNASLIRVTYLRGWIPAQTSHFLQCECTFSPQLSDSTHLADSSSRKFSTLPKVHDKASGWNSTHQQAVLTLLASQKESAQNRQFWQLSLHLLTAWTQEPNGTFTSLSKFINVLYINLIKWGKYHFPWNEPCTFRCIVSTYYT